MIFSYYVDWGRGVLSYNRLLLTPWIFRHSMRALSDPGLGRGPTDSVWVVPNTWPEE